MDPFSVVKLLVFNPMTSASASSMRMEISTTIHLISFKPILPIRQLYTMTMMRNAEATMAEIMTMKATATTTMTIINRHKREKSLVVVGTVVLILIQKKECHSM